MKGPLQSLGIFVISIVVLLVIGIAGNINTHKATGLGVLHYKG